MNEVFGEFKDEYTGAETLAAAAGVAVGFGSLWLERDDFWHISQAEAATNTVNSLNNEINGLKHTETVFAAQPESFKARVDGIMNHQILKDQHKVTATIEHNPQYAKGQKAEAIAMGVAGMAIAAAIAAVGAHRARKTMHNFRAKRQSREQDTTTPDATSLPVI